MSDWLLHIIGRAFAHTCDLRICHWLLLCPHNAQMLPFCLSIMDTSLQTGGAVTILNACVCSVVSSSHRLLDIPLVWVLCKQKIITALNLTCTLFLHGAWVDEGTR